MLLNFSNHPSPDWPDVQRRTAIDLYDEIQDLAFSLIPPEADTDDVWQMVEEYELHFCRLVAEALGLTVHLMGELTFNFLLIGRLLIAGSSCAASMTQQIVVEEADGRKISQFRFVRFRHYSQK